MHSLAERVRNHIRQHELLKAGERVGVAVSGGIDSVALLRLLLELRGELGIVLSVVHFNHKLRGTESDGDEEFVAGLARAHDLEFICDSDDVAGHAADERVSVETAARELRYGFFQSLIGAGPQGLKPRSSSDSSGAAGSRAPSNLDSGSIGAQSRTPSGLDSGSIRAAELRAVSNPHSGSIRAQSRAPSGLDSDSSGAPEHCRDAKNDSDSSGTGELAGVSNPRRGVLDKVLTGHTLDDQAETVLMRLIRGSGLRGLSGIHPRLMVEDEGGENVGEIVRPLLAFRRRELEQYLNCIGQTWREDATNADDSFTRNRVRRRLVPLLETEFNPAVTENLAELAEIARGEEDYWENEVAGWMGTGIHWSQPEWARAAWTREALVQIAGATVSTDRDADGRFDGQPSEADDLQSRIENAPWLTLNASVDRFWFLGESPAVQRRAVKAIGDEAGIPLEFKHIEEIVRFGLEESGSGKELSLPLGWKLVRHPEELLFVTPDLRACAPQPQDYEYPLRVPGGVAIEEAGFRMEVHIVSAEAAEYNRDQLLDADSVTGPLVVRNWRAGDRFWPAHTKSPKKIKDLLQDRHVAQPERRLWPVVVSGTEIVWVRSFPVPATLRAKPGQPAIVIREYPLMERAEP